MPETLFEHLLNRGLISESSYQKLKDAANSHKISLHREIRVLLYLGILLISSGAGVLIYRHINQLGHLVIVGSLSLTCLACYGYSFWWQHNFRPVKKPTAVLPDYILLLGSLLLLSLIGYLQAQFHLFGIRWGLASFIPMVLLFATAYYFDHKGVLSLAIINLAAWAGITINKGTWYGITELNHDGTIITAGLLAVGLILWSDFVRTRSVKPHFSDIYKQFGFHGLFLSAIAGVAHFTLYYPVWLLLLFVAGYFFLKNAFKENSVYYMVVTCLYMYVGVSYVFTAKLFSKFQGDGELYANLFYYLVTGIAMAFLLNALNKKIKSNGRLS